MTPRCLAPAGLSASYTVRPTQLAARAVYREAGICDPRKEVTQLEVHDCFSITELVTMKDLGLSGPGRGVADVLDGRYDADGAIPCQTDGVSNVYSEVCRAPGGVGMLLFQELLSGLRQPVFLQSAVRFIR
jgi:acetyl-CoA acetyltransferase